MFEHDPVLFYMIIGPPIIAVSIILLDKFINWYLNPIAHETHKRPI